MFRTVTPLTIFQQQVDLVQGLLPGILDGRLDSIHDARIATRRIREVLPLTHEWLRRHVADDLFTRFKKMGRSLGQVRDADVRTALLRYLEARVPLAAPWLVTVRQQQEAKRHHLMRKLLKRFERLSVETELARLAGGAPWRSRLWVARAGAWRNELRRLLADRAIGTHHAVMHATGVYFPNRVHHARIAIKKFRYAAEIAAHTGYLIDGPLIRDLKKSADTLGDLHDRQTLIDDLTRTAAQDTPSQLTDRAEEMRTVAQVVAAEIQDLHARYLERRPRIIDAADRTVRDLRRPRVPSTALAVAGVVAATGAEVIRRSLRGRRASAEAVSADRDEPTISVRVPVPLSNERDE